MSATSHATARLMETWAHGQDIVDTLGMERGATPRLKHIAHLGVRTRAYSYIQHELTPPSNDVHVELDAPGGEVWTWGASDVEDRVSGPALDFCRSSFSGDTSTIRTSDITVRMHANGC